MKRQKTLPVEVSKKKKKKRELLPLFLHHLGHQPPMNGPVLLNQDAQGHDDNDKQGHKEQHGVLLHKVLDGGPDLLEPAFDSRLPRLHVLELINLVHLVGAHPPVVPVPVHDHSARRRILAFCRRRRLGPAVDAKEPLGRRDAPPEHVAVTALAGQERAGLLQVPCRAAAGCGGAGQWERGVARQGRRQDLACVRRGLLVGARPGHIGG